MSTFKRSRGLIALFVLVFLLGLIAQLPAAVLAPPLLDLTRQRLRLENPQGTVWSGKAHLSCRLPDESSVACGDWQWRFMPAALLEGRLRLGVQGARPSETALLTLSAAGFEVERISLELPAMLIGSLDAKIAALKLGGYLHVDGRQLAARSGQAQIVWRNMSSRLAPNVALGEHTLNLNATAQAWNVEMGTISGPLRFAGGGQIPHNGAAKLDLTATVAANDVRLAPLLSLMGMEASPGVFHMQLQ